MSQSGFTDQRVSHNTDGGFRYCAVAVVVIVIVIVVAVVVWPVGLLCGGIPRFLARFSNLKHILLLKKTNQYSLSVYF